MVNKKGFTLIELLIVISIVGLLASIVLVGLGNFRSRGRDARRVADMRSVQNMLELYFTRNSSYPNSGAGGAMVWTGLGSLTEDITTGGIGVNNVPNDPLAGRNYLYGAGTCSGSPLICLNYVLGATIEDATNEALQNDVNTNPLYGIDCTNPVYCVSF